MSGPRLRVVEREPGQPVDPLLLVLGPAEDLVDAVRRNNGRDITAAITTAGALMFDRHLHYTAAEAHQVSPHELALCGYWGASAIAILLAAAIDGDTAAAGLVRMTLWTEHRAAYTRLRQLGHVHRCAAFYAPVIADLPSPADTSCCGGT